MFRSVVKTSRKVASFHVNICCSSVVGRVPSSNNESLCGVPTFTNVRMRKGGVLSLDMIGFPEGVVSISAIALQARAGQAEKEEGRVADVSKT